MFSIIGNVDAQHNLEIHRATSIPQWQSCTATTRVCLAGFCLSGRRDLNPRHPTWDGDVSAMVNVPLDKLEHVCYIQLCKLNIENTLGEKKESEIRDGLSWTQPHLCPTKRERDQETRQLFASDTTYPCVFPSLSQRCSNHRFFLGYLSIAHLLTQPAHKLSIINYHLPITINSLSIS